MDRGYIKLFRKISDNDLWKAEPFTRGQAWVDLLLIANRKPGIIRKRGIVVNLKAGDVGFSLRNLAARWQWSVNKVRRFVAELEETHKMVEHKTSNVTGLIHIKNYNQYQVNGTQTNTQTEHKRIQNKKTTKKTTTTKRKFGEFKNVLLKEEELKKLQDKFNGGCTERIENLSNYLESTGKKYKSHYATILNWARKEKPKQKDSRWA